MIVWAWFAFFAKWLLRRGCICIKDYDLWVWDFGYLLCGLEVRKTQKYLYKTSTRNVYCKHCNYRIINIIQDITHNNIGFQIAHQNRRYTLPFSLFIISTSEHVQRKAISQSRYVSISLYYYRSCGQCYITSQKVIF